MDIFTNKLNNMKCKDCTHWKSEQAELGYSKFIGICICPIWRFSVSTEGDVMLLDRENRANKFSPVQRFETQNENVPVGQREASRYCFVTDEKFGCIHFSDKKK